MLVFRSTPDVSWTLLVKEIIDRVSAFVALLLFAIPMGIVALMIRITSRGPAIFRQRRAGKHGKPFVMYKFRSMSDDAEMRRVELEPFNQMQGPVFKVEWQISGRNRVRDFRDWVKLDLDYIDHWSLGLDFKILLRTIPAVLLGSGAK